MSIEKDKATVVQFNDFIAARDIEGLARMMTDDHVFIDAANSKVVGKSAGIQAWRVFFAAFPDYRNDFAQISTAGELIVMTGHSSCFDPRLSGPALWTAKVQGHQISEWRVLEDSAHNRNMLGLAS
jgi:ketosteroid isomerase-like protein